MSIIKINRNDLSVDIEITASEWGRFVGILFDALTASKINFEAGRFGNVWSFEVEDEDADPANAIVEKAIEGGFGQWTDAANDA